MGLPQGLGPGSHARPGSLEREQTQPWPTASRARNPAKLIILHARDQSLQAAGTCRPFTYFGSQPEGWRRSNAMPQGYQVWPRILNTGLPLSQESVVRRHFGGEHSAAGGLSGGVLRIPVLGKRGRVRGCLVVSHSHPCRTPAHQLTKIVSPSASSPDFSARARRPCSITSSRGKVRYKFAIIVNEVGKIGIDGQLVENQKDEMVELSNGCVCCTVRKDLVQEHPAVAQEGRVRLHPH